MALPRSSIPPYVNQSFLTAQSEGQLNRAQELFFRYHPAVLQRQSLDVLLKGAEFQAAQDAQQREFLQKELSRVRDLRARYREAGKGALGAADLAVGMNRGRGGRGGGGGGGGSGDMLDFINATDRNDVDRYEARLKALESVNQMVDEQDRKPRQYDLFEKDFLAYLDRQYRGGRASPADLAIELNEKFFDYTSKLAGNVDQTTLYQRKRAATDLYYGLRRRFPSVFETADGTISAAAIEVIAAIDEAYETNGFLEQAIISNVEPLGVVENDRRTLREAYTQAIGGTPRTAEQTANRIISNMTDAELDLDKDGTVTDAEREDATRRAMTQARKELGIAEPLSDEELVLLDRYTRALSNDGRATFNEFASREEALAAKAAYDKGRRTENLPRGYSPFYDQTYLDLLGDEAQIERQLSGLARPEDALQGAARQLTGDIALPDLPPEVLEAAAAAGGPLAADSLPFAMKRYIATAGSIDPQTPVERVAQKLIDADPDGRPTFEQFAAQVGKKYFNDPAKRREALAYYGAYFRAKDLQNDTLVPPDEDAGRLRDVISEIPSAPPSAPPSPRRSGRNRGEGGKGGEGVVGQPTAPPAPRDLFESEVGFQTDEELGQFDAGQVALPYGTFAARPTFPFLPFTSGPMLPFGPMSLGESPDDGRFDESEVDRPLGESDAGQVPLRYGSFAAPPSFPFTPFTPFGPTTPQPLNLPMIPQRRQLTLPLGTNITQYGPPETGLPESIPGEPVRGGVLAAPQFSSDFGYLQRTSPSPVLGTPRPAAVPTPTSPSVAENVGPFGESPLSEADALRLLLGPIAAPPPIRQPASLPPGVAGPNQFSRDFGYLQRTSPSPVVRRTDFPTSPAISENMGPVGESDPYGESRVLTREEIERRAVELVQRRRALERARTQSEADRQAAEDALLLIERAGL